MEEYIDSTNDPVVGDAGKDSADTTAEQQRPIATDTDADVDDDDDDEDVGGQLRADNPLPSFLPSPPAGTGDAAGAAIGAIAPQLFVGTFQMLKMAMPAGSLPGVPGLPSVPGK